jgi:hypothetical protein
MDIKKIIQEEIRKVLKEFVDYEVDTEKEFPRILQSTNGFVLGMAAMGAGGKEHARSIESPYFKTAEEVCKFYSNWDPSMAIQESLRLDESSNNFSILGDPEEICAVNEEMFEASNLPAGAEFDSNAPWNDDKNTRQGERAKEIKFEVVWAGYNAGFAIVKDKAGKLYAFNTEMVETEDYEPYADREETYLGRDEDGDPDVEYGDWDLDKDVIEQYINDNLGDVRVGKGLDAWESGDFEAVGIDDEVKADLEGTAKYIKDTKEKQELLGLLGGINEIAQKLVDVPTMDTPTGTLFTISVGE